jgi:RNA polymerase subunit RPABC4/transcription elongation factor Spt4
MKKCNKCGFESEDDLKFCGHCGASLEDIHKCQKCGYTLSLDLSFCPNCGAKVESTQKTEIPVKVKKTKNQEIKKKVFGIVSIVLLFSSLVIVLISLSLNWLTINAGELSNAYNNGSIFRRTILQIYGTQNHQIFGTSLYTSLFTSIDMLKTVQSSLIIPENNISTMLLVIPFFFIFVIQLSIFIIFLVTLIKSIVLVTKNKPFSKFVIKAYGAMIVLFIIGIVILGEVNTIPLMGLIVCVIVELVFIIFDRLLAPQKTNIASHIPNIIGTTLLIISLFFIAASSKISFPVELSGYFSLTYVLSGVQKNLFDLVGIIHSYRYVLSIDYQLFIITIINLVAIITSAIILGIYAKKRFSNTLDKVKASTKALGWVLIGLLLALYVTDILLGKIYVKDFEYFSTNINVSHGATLVVVILVLLTQVADLINIGPKQAQVELSPKDN